MDNQKVHDPQLSYRDNESRLQKLLNSKIEEASQTTEENSQSNSLTTPRSAPQARRILPDYSFKFVAHHVKDSVEYEIQLAETYKVLRRTVTENYKFKTQYSKLQNLSIKLGNRGFPPKKIFGNKDAKFIEKRKQDLENYLNGKAEQKSPQFLEFIKQVKHAHIQADFKSDFRLP